MDCGRLGEIFLLACCEKSANGLRHVKDECAYAWMGLMKNLDWDLEGGIMCAVEI